ncbi:hypothetical protein [Rhizobacter sp. SG703]|uniref:hypothetical protein n=1 Tax=Rhizobacter sp. SG703 TaxID=2587140 RepID=UPI0014465A1B|nr:hypothetical protein [Rhizobacter sp. SG703]NKI97318.1 hypothetical protein [Rhizobacter sp. SG703]
MSRRFNAIRQSDEVWPAIEAVLLPLGFVRTGHVFHRRSDTDLVPRLEAMAFRFEYNFRTCWMHATVKMPAFIELLHGVREFAYRPELAWQVPDHASHVACMVRMSEMGAQGSPLHEGVCWREDGRLQRRRRTPGAVLGEAFASIAREYALPLFDRRLTVQGLAGAADSPAYPKSGVGGAWSLAARLALRDLDGAARAFRAHPYSLGDDFSRVAAAKAWLMRQGVEVSDVMWSADAADAAYHWQAQAWLNGEVVR